MSQTNTPPASIGQGDITELREILFGTLRGLKNKSIKAEDARAINDTARVIVDTAKVEVAFLQAVGGKGTGFIPPPGLPAPANNDAADTTIVEIRPGVTVRQHKLRG